VESSERVHGEEWESAEQGGPAGQGNKGAECRRKCRPRERWRGGAGQDRARRQAQIPHKPSHHRRWHIRHLSGGAPVVLTHGAQQEAQPAASLGKEEEGSINRSQQDKKLHETPPCKRQGPRRPRQEWLLGGLLGVPPSSKQGLRRLPQSSSEGGLQSFR